MGNYILSILEKIKSKRKECKIFIVKYKSKRMEYLEEYYTYLK